VPEAIRRFTKAGRYNQAARLAREHGLTAELQSLSLQAPAQMQGEAASFFEDKGQFDKAVQVRARALCSTRYPMPHPLAVCDRG
jgi:intraflagellar transport protein 140